MTGGALPAAELWAVAEAAADAAAAVTLRHFRGRALLAESKAETFDPVTVADREAEAAIRAALRDRRPADGVVGEEQHPEDGVSGLTWVIDPIDGTRGYISGTPTWGTLIALRDADGPVLGLIDQPYIGERFMGGLGRAAWRGPQGEGALAVRPARELSEAVLFTTFPEIGTPEDRAAFDRVAETVRLVRYGMDCYAYALLALGQIDLVIEAGLHAYDIAAPIAVIEAAGGLVTDWEGRPVHDGGRALAAASPELHAAALARLAGGETACPEG
ncbi:MAG: histidinol-phosphatase [Paracoccaceae bacterium]|nr:histidinol-phosphatase [Paracoccaceae bacterium]